jgi:hypothetical protein
VFDTGGPAVGKGSVTISAMMLQDDEGREVAIKIDRVDPKKFSLETATKTYIEVCGVCVLCLGCRAPPPLTVNVWILSNMEVMHFAWN